MEEKEEYEDIKRTSKEGEIKYKPFFNFLDKIN